MSNHILNVASSAYINNPAVFISLTVLSLILVTLTSGLFVFDLIKNKHIGSKALCLALCFVSGILFWLGVLLGTDSFSFGTLFSNTIKMFAFSVEDTDLPFALNEFLKDSYYYYTLSCLYIEEVIFFSTISLAILTSVGRSILAFLKCLKNWIISKPFSERKVIIFTDLSYWDLEDFLTVRRNAKDVILIVLKQDEQTTQEGTELRSSFLSHGYYVKTGPVYEKYIKKLTSNFFFEQTKIYSCFKADEDNLAFADEALSFCRKRYEGKRKNRYYRSKIAFFISYQDPDFENKYNYSSDSHGLISFFSEYDWVSSLFVFQNPALRVIDLSRSERLYESLNIRPRFHVDYLGFGGINKALLKKMIPGYYLPDDLKDIGNDRKIYPEVSFRIFDKDENCTKESILADYPCCKVTNSDKYLLPYAMPSVEVINKDLLLENEIEIYCREVIEKILNHGEQIMIFVSVGNTHDNVELASKVRSRIIQAIDDGSVLSELGNKKTPSKKSILIYPYIKEASLFRADYSFYSSYLDKKKEWDSVSFKIDKPHYESSRLYVFEMNSETDSSLLNKENDFARLRNLSRTLFKKEDVPIIPFGRGGYFPSDDERHIKDIAKATNLVYGINDSSPYLTPDNFYSFPKEEMNKEWGESLSLPYQARSNFYLAISLPNTLRFLHMRLRSYVIADQINKKENPSLSATEIKDKKNIDNLACYNEIQKFAPSFLKHDSLINEKRWNEEKENNREVLQMIDYKTEGSDNDFERNRVLMMLASKMQEKVSAFFTSITKEKIGILSLPDEKDISFYDWCFSVYLKYVKDKNLNKKQLKDLKERQKEFFEDLNFVSVRSFDSVFDKLKTLLDVKDDNKVGFSLVALTSLNLSENEKWSQLSENENRESETKPEIDGFVSSVLIDPFRKLWKYFDSNTLIKNPEFVIPKEFIRIVRSAYVKELDIFFVRHNRELKGETGLVSSIRPYVETSYNLGEKTLITDKGLQIAKLEHARWFFFNAGNKVMPKTKSCLFDEEKIKPQDVKIKNALKTVHLCMTDYKGLMEIEKQLVRELPLAKPMLSDLVLPPVSPDDGNDKFKDCYPVFSKALEFVYSLCYWADTFSVAESASLLKYRKGNLDDCLRIQKQKKRIRYEKQYYYLSKENNEK